MPALRALQRGLDAEVVLATPAPLHPLARLLGLRCVPCAPLQAPPVQRPALAVNLHGRGPQSHEALQATRPGALWGFDLPGGPPWPDGVHERERWCALLRHHGVAADPLDLRLDPPPPPRPEWIGATVIHPGAASPARRWPHWAAVARSLEGPVVATAGAGEEALAAAVGGEVAAGLDVLELAGLVAHAGLLLCSDTGVAHLASAFGTPSVVLFGPVPPSEWGPPEGGPHEVLWAGRRGDPHGQVVDPGLAAIAPEAVLSAARRAARRSPLRGGAAAPSPARATPASG